MTDMVARGGNVDDEIAGREISGILRRFDHFLVESSENCICRGTAFFNTSGVTAIQAAIDQVAETSDHGFNDWLSLISGSFVCSEARGHGIFFRSALVGTHTDGLHSFDVFLVTVGMGNEIGVFADVFDWGKDCSQKGSSLSFRASPNARGRGVGECANFGQQFFVVDFLDVIDFRLFEFDEKFAESFRGLGDASFGAAIIFGAAEAVTKFSFQCFVDLSIEHFLQTGRCIAHHGDYNES